MQLNDHINRFVDHDIKPEDVLSPMDPPEKFAPSTVVKVPYEKMAKPLQLLMTDHKSYLDILTRFEDALIQFKKENWIFNNAISKVFKEFFLFVDTDLVQHHLKEEKVLFPLLQERFLQSGEHSPGDDPRTPIDIMEDDHIKLGQTNCLVFNLLGIGSRVDDAKSRHIIFEHAYNQGQDLVERMKLHIFKEDEVVFPLAQKLITAAEFETMAGKMTCSHKPHTA